MGQVRGTGLLMQPDLAIVKVVTGIPAPEHPGCNVQ